MRVLVLHSRYLSGATSGENRVVDDEVRLLKAAGHSVELWDPSLDSVSMSSRIKSAAEAVWSRASASTVHRLIVDTRPDVVHCHNLFPNLSPSVLRAVHSTGTPTLITLHNYRLMCLPATFFRDGHVCEECLGRIPWRGVAYGCYRDSKVGSLPYATSLTLHRAIHTFEQVSLFLAVSRFVLDKHREAGIDEARLRVKRNFSWPLPRRSGPGDYFLFLGRFAKEKGLRMLLDAWEDLDAELLLIGEGPDGDALKELAPANVRFQGSVPAEAVPELLRSARAVLVPSLWGEPAPRVITEAYSAGVPVLASRMGGLPEMVDQDVSGLLVDNDPGSWKKAIERLARDEESERLGEGARALWEQEYSPKRALSALEQAYRDVMGPSSSA